MTRFMPRPADIPNAICVLRILLVAPILWALAEGRHGLALVLVCVAGFSDALDGYLAKRLDWRSRLGGLLDPLADKVLLVSMFLALAWLQLVPEWLAMVVIGRDIVIVCGGVAYHFLIGPVEPEPSPLSKINTAAQIACVIAVLCAVALGWPSGEVVYGLALLVLVTSLASGVDYVVRWSRRAARTAHG